MATLAETRQTLCNVLSVATEGLTFYPRRPKSAGPGDGWVSPGPVRPGATNLVCDATLSVVILLSADEAVAEDLFDQLATGLVDTVTQTAGLFVSEVSVAPETIAFGDSTPGPMFGLVITLSVEVS